MAIFPVPNLQIEDYPADNRHIYPGNTTPRLIILHATVGRDSLKWLTVDKNSDVSSNRLIPKDGRNLKLVPDDRIANTQGYAIMGPHGPNGIYNVYDKETKRYVLFNDNIRSYCLSIELENLNDGIDPYTDEQLQTTVEQCIEWQSLHTIFAILPHSMIDRRKTDPYMFPWDKFGRMYWRYAQKVLKSWQ